VALPIPRVSVQPVTSGWSEKADAISSSSASEHPHGMFSIAVLQRSASGAAGARPSRVKPPPDPPAVACMRLSDRVLGLVASREFVSLPQQRRDHAKLRGSPDLCHM
jgi:hypothetical protein